MKPKKTKNGSDIREGIREYSLNHPRQVYRNKIQGFVLDEVAKEYFIKDIKKRPPKELIDLGMNIDEIVNKANSLKMPLSAIKMISPIIDMIMDEVITLPEELSTKARNKPIIEPEFYLFDTLTREPEKIKKIQITLEGKSRPISFTNEWILGSFKELLKYYHQREWKFKKYTQGNLKNETKFMEYLHQVEQISESLAIATIRNIFKALLPSKSKDYVNGLTHEILEIIGLRKSNHSIQAKRSFIEKKCKGISQTKFT